VTAGVRFEIRAASDAHTLLRLLNYFAQRGLTPSSVRADVVGTTAFVVIEQAALEPGHASIIAEKMRCSVLAEEVVFRALP
jgi:hypothetical protein